ncbi:hypothetical protein ACIRNI_31625 [Streptomyces sp. NPDC093546]|uniref:hypothetical protein n=1 Tax=Streptomyces sp. NPDC093546 TaxID=3366040 RepID=UPI0037F20B15
MTIRPTRNAAARRRDLDAAAVSRAQRGPRTAGHGTATGPNTRPRAAARRERYGDHSRRRWQNGARARGGARAAAARQQDDGPTAAAQPEAAEQRRA